MNRILYIFFFSGVFAVAELFLRSWGITFPCCAYFVFYAATAFGTNSGIACAVLSAMALDFFSGAEHPWSIISLGTIVYFASFWLNKVESDSIMLNFLPGIAISFIMFPFNVFFFAHRFLPALLEHFPGVLPSGAAGAILMPLLVYVLDTLNHKLGLPLFTDARVRRKYL